MPEADAGEELDRELTLMREAALRAGAIAVSYTERGETEAWDKAPGHPVTEADLAVNAYLEDTLRAARPDYAWLSEETVDQTDRLKARRLWVVDPIDGTRAFMRGDPRWCVGLSLVEDGAPVAAVIYAPALGECFEARRGGGAWLNGERLSAGDASEIKGARLITSRQLINHPDWREPWPEIRYVEPRPNATLYRLALVAAGRADATFVLWRKSDWDLAAGVLLLEEAGGCATTHRGERFVFNRLAPAQQSLVAAGKTLHPLLVDRTRAARLPDPQEEARLAASETQETEAAMSESPAPKPQLLHIVFGGVLKDVSDVVFEDLSEIDFVGAYSNYNEAYDAWKSAAQRTVDNAEMRYFILHAHRLLDPETGVHHHA